MEFAHASQFMPSILKIAVFIQFSVRPRTPDHLRFTELNLPLGGASKVKQWKEGPVRVKSEKAQNEQMFSGLKADLLADGEVARTSAIRARGLLQIACRCVVQQARTTRPRMARGVLPPYRVRQLAFQERQARLRSDSRRGAA